MRLSSVVLPDKEGFPPGALCLRQENTNLTKLIKGDVLSFDTYFGSFTVDKWKKYTTIGRFVLRIEAEGLLRIGLFSAPIAPANGAVRELGAWERDFEKERALTFEMPIDAEGIVYFSVETLSETAAFFGAGYEGEPIEQTDIRIGINTCTYRREPYIYKNMAVLNDGIFQNPGSFCRGNLQAFVVDNGQTLDSKLLPPDVHLIYNENTGGSGGYIRGMEEISRAKKTFTHVVMMDDDIRLHPETLERLYTFLKCLKPEYRAHPIAGAMLNLHTTIQHEAGGVWHDTQVEVRKAGLDLEDFSNVRFNEWEESFDFGGWWFCCIPMVMVKRCGLPMRFFIKHDDVEYGLRMNHQPLTLNGLCVWHEPFEHKYNAAMEYYLVRNGLCVNERHRPGFTKQKAKQWLLRLYVSNIFRYRYGEFEIILKAFEDFADGSWKEKEPGALHGQILAMAPALSPLSERPEGADSVNSKEQNKPGFVKKLIIALTLNGMIFPLRGETIVAAYQNAFWSYFRKKRVYNAIEGTERGFWVTCDRRRAWRLLLKCLKVMRTLGALPSERLP